MVVFMSATGWICTFCVPFDNLVGGSKLILLQQWTKYFDFMFDTLISVKIQITVVYLISLFHSTVDSPQKGKVIVILTFSLLIPLRLQALKSSF